MNRKIKKQFWLNRMEAQELKIKARKACLSEAALIRYLIKGYEPKEKPDEEFYDVLDELRNISERLSIIESSDYDDEIMESIKLKEEIKRLHKFQSDVEIRFLRPDRKNLKWQ